jgi:hypothetical protein
MIAPKITPSVAMRVTAVTTTGPCDWCAARARFVVESEHTNRAGQCCYRHCAAALRWIGAPAAIPTGGLS